MQNENICQTIQFKVQCDDVKLEHDRQQLKTKLMIQW